MTTDYLTLFLCYTSTEYFLALVCWSRFNWSSFYISNLTTEEGADCVHAFLGWQDYFELTISDIDDKEDDDVLTENEVKLRKTLSELLVAMQENEIEFILFDKY